MKALTELHERITAEMTRMHAFYLSAEKGSYTEGYFDGKEVALSQAASMVENLIQDVKGAVTVL